MGKTTVPKHPRQKQMTELRRAWAAVVSEIVNDPNQADAEYIVLREVQTLLLATHDVLEKEDALLASVPVGAAESALHKLAKTAFQGWRRFGRKRAD